MTRRYNPLLNIAVSDALHGVPVTVDEVCTLDEFLEANESEERGDILTALETAGFYQGGGGAAPIFTITLARRDPKPPARDIPTELHQMQLVGRAMVGDRVETVYIRLPKELQRSTGGPCSCPHCNGKEGFWDTLAIPTGHYQRDGGTWTVHMPEPRNDMQIAPSSPARAARNAQKDEDPHHRNCKCQMCDPDRIPAGLTTADAIKRARDNYEPAVAPCPQCGVRASHAHYPGSPFGDWKGAQS